ncbi:MULTISPECIES: class II fructose-bisphosphate aldolase [Micromonospora]|uniref:Fructose-bisphosphate aldolase n=1 Tax=Micromonospora yangpuensis TaxID=683228 RepID=A0A1C6U4K0_9ACTN|nr:class II fructose-bisphosphate aldolase [Micromonospora yangpuensis]GGL92640.1 fructose-bisphosphate aldolase [Micromonospora yangpuensis]SCL48924.1 fructose-bisphosphate aldolase [Micromonospora yangpuensis]
MGLVSGLEVIEQCVSRGLVAGAFNTTNIETTMGIVQAVENTRVPTFIQVAPTNAVLSGYEYIHDMVSRRLAKVDVPVALHLDHGRTLDDVKQSLAAGFTSIMMDASGYEYDKNVDLSRQARDLTPTEYALEVELGSIGGKEDDLGPEREATTDPDQVAGFVTATGCEMLAVSVGNVHGYAPGVRIDMDLLRRVQRASAVPLVVHGGSGLPREQLSRLAEYGVVKVNIASDLRNAMIRTFGEAYAANPNEYALIRVSQKAVTAITDVVESRIRTLNPKLG